MEKRSWKNSVTQRRVEELLLRFPHGQRRYFYMKLATSIQKKVVKFHLEIIRNYEFHHDKEKETSINIYVGLKLYSTVRSRTLVYCLFQFCICISYDRILSITKSLYEALRTTFGHYKILLPTNLKKGCFTVSAKDNIDKNATTNLVQSHFHGTDISLFQLLNHENQGESFDYHGFIYAA